MKYEISTFDDDHQSAVLEFSGVTIGLSGDSLVMFSAEDEQPVCAFAAGMWTTLRRVD